MRSPAKKRIFDDGSGASRRVVMPWGQTVRMCLANVKQRLGRSVLTFICIAVVVAFFSSSMVYQDFLVRLMASPDVHVQAVLERAGVFVHDVDSLARQRDQRIWLMTLSAVLCLVGITNTILMSVTERFREIGTLKCLGALDVFVVRLFLIENALIGGLASLLGAAVGCLLAVLQLGAVFEFSLLSWGFCAEGMFPGAAKSVAVGTFLTLLASIYPTYVAARMRPVDAMRSEV